MKNFRRKLICCCLVAVAALAWTSPLVADKPAPIKVGATLMLTGYGAAWGKNAQQGIELALTKVNSEGGINGRPMQALYEDFGELDLKRAATAAQKLISTDKVAALLTLIIEDSEVVCPIAERHGLLTISVGAGSRESSELCGSLFRTTTSDDELVNRGIDYALRAKKVRACVLADQVRYYESFADYTAERWRETTGSTPVVVKFPWGTTDFRSVLAKVKGNNCDVIFLQTGIPAQGVILKQAKGLGIDALFVGPPTTDDPGVLSVAGDAAEGVIFAKFKTGSLEFAREYQSRFGELPSRPAATAYDAVQLLAKAFREKGTSSDLLRTALMSTRDFVGVSGPVTIDPNQKRLGEIAELLKISKGVAHSVGQT